MKTSLKYHLLFAVLLLIYSTAPLWITTNDNGDIAFFDPPMSPKLITVLLFNALLMSGLSFYSMYLFIMPRLYIKKNKTVFWIAFIILLIGVYCIAYISYSFMFYWFIDGIFRGYFGFAFFNFQVILLFMFFGGAAYYMIGWRAHKLTQLQLQKKNKELELALLRSQFNPHFLFNTLNNIAAFLANDPLTSLNSITRLDNLITSLQSVSFTEKIDFDIEIKNLQAYAELINLKYKDKNFVKLDIKGNTTGISVYPMILIPLLENANKHGCSTDIMPGISCMLEVNDQKLKFNIQNFIANESTKEKNSGGTGIKNMIKRLNLIYPNNYRFQAKQFDNKYNAFLEINHESV